MDLQIHEKPVMTDSIAKMLPGYFWAKIESLSGEPPKTAEELATLYHVARNSLAAREVPGFRDWMSSRRAAC